MRVWTQPHNADERQCHLDELLLLDEDLIKYAWSLDVWFHVNKLSSAHVYHLWHPHDARRNDDPVTRSHWNL